MRKEVSFFMTLIRFYFYNEVFSHPDFLSSQIRGNEKLSDFSSFYRTYFIAPFIIKFTVRINDSLSKIFVDEIQNISYFNCSNYCLFDDTNYRNSIKIKLD